MKFTSEIFLTKKYITKEEWNELINTISKYNRIKPWKIIITNNNNQLRYYIKTTHSLPPTINNLNSFLFKKSNNIYLPNYSYSLATFPKIGINIIDIINYCEIKNKGTLKYLEITFFKLYDNKVLSRTNYYIEKNNKTIRYHIILAIPTNILSINFENNKRYFYKSIPKYLESNKILHILDCDYKNSILSVETFPYSQETYYLNHNKYNFNKHSVIIGSSGCGKSKFISSLISKIKNTDSKSNYKIVVIDPHASLKNDIGGLGNVIDFNSISNSINLFSSTNDIISSTELLLDLLKSLIADQYNSKLERILRHSIYLLLTDKSFNFINLKKLILDIEYRTSLIKKQKYNLPSSIIDFFLSDFNDLKTKSYGESISPIISFIDELEIIPVFRDNNIKKNLIDSISENDFTLFSLDRTKLGNKVTKTIAGLIMEQLLNIIQSHLINEHIIFIIDEVSIIENSILPIYLSEARKYNLSLIIASQYFNQISEQLKSSIFANVINFYIFRVSKTDAVSIIDNINIKIPIDDTKEAKIKLLTELNNRECIVRIESNETLLSAFKAKTLDFKSIPPKKITNNKTNNFKENKNINNEIIFKTNNINLHELLKSTSTGRKELKENE